MVKNLELNHSNMQNEGGHREKRITMDGFMKTIRLDDGGEGFIKELELSPEK